MHEAGLPVFQLLTTGNEAGWSAILPVAGRMVAAVDDSNLMSVDNVGMFSNGDKSIR